VAGEGTVELGFEAIANALEGIRLERGYRHDVIRVYRTFEPMMMDNLSTLQSPSLAVGRTPGQDAAFSWLGDEGYEVTVPTTIIGYLKRGSENAEDDRAAPRAEAFVADVVKALMADCKFGTMRAETGEVKESKILATDHGASWDDSGIFVEVRFEFYAVVSANP
jgi:hypothetical protein